MVAREARLRAELLLVESDASLEAMARLAAEIRANTDFAKELQHECARAMTQVWRFSGDMHTIGYVTNRHMEQEEGSFTVGNLVTTIVAGVATAIDAMDCQVWWELDQTGWAIFAGCAAYGRQSGRSAALTVLGGCG